MNSRTYQLAAEPNTNAGDENQLSTPWFTAWVPNNCWIAKVRSLGSASICRISGRNAAAQLPGVRPESKGKRRANQLDQFLELFRQAAAPAGDRHGKIARMQYGQRFR
jgi:hypothetical protein